MIGGGLPAQDMNLACRTGMIRGATGALTTLRLTRQLRVQPLIERNGTLFVHRKLRTSTDAGAPAKVFEGRDGTVK